MVVIPPTKKETHESVYNFHDRFLPIFAMRKQILFTVSLALALAAGGSLLWLHCSNGSYLPSVSADSDNAQKQNVQGSLKGQNVDSDASRVQPSQQEATITISFHSPVSLLLIDPLGHRLGDDPSTSATYNEIPRGSYDAGGLADDETGAAEEDPAKSMFIPAPIHGQYRLKVTGTADGAYSADFTIQRADASTSSATLQNVPIGSNQAQTYTFTYEDAPGSSLHLVGGLHDDEPNPDLVNQLLSYKVPKDSHVLLAADTATFRVTISYSANIIPGTFSAALGGENISTLFRPHPGTSEDITIPMKPGHKFLDVTVSGNVAGRIGTDTNRLVFDLNPPNTAR
mgnify:CR=1 FL=1